MPESYKGLVEAYQIICKEFEESFYEWIFPEDGINRGIDLFLPGQICLAPAWYEKKNRWFFTEGIYEPTNEPESTWKAHIYNGTILKAPETCVKKYFDLEMDENLLGTHGKNRPVILIKNYISNWANPGIEKYKIDRWLCLPIFTYKKRHNQEYVNDDLCFNNPDRIYIPVEKNPEPGVKEESAIQLEAIQMVNEKYLQPLKCMCNDGKITMQRPFRVSNFALKIIIYHFMKSFDIFNAFMDKKIEDESQYELFVEMVRDLVRESTKTSTVTTV